MRLGAFSMIRRLSFHTVLLFAGITVAAGQPRLTFNTSAVNFGNVRVGDISQLNQATLLLTNSGSDTLRITSIIFTDPHFSSNTTTLSVAPRGYVGDPNGSFLDTLHFIPATAGPDSAWLIITSNSSSS